MTWQNLDNYFQNVQSTFVQTLFADCEFPWTPLNRLSNQIEQHFKCLENQGQILADRTILTNSDGSFREGAYTIQQTQILQNDLIDTELKIHIKAGTLIESGAIIKNHSIIETNCEVRQGAYIRGYVYIGEKSVVGHTTEMKNSIFIKHVEAGHFAYIGDSIVGSYVNLGAGTKISNLEFRSLKAKQQDIFPKMKFSVNKNIIKTGLSKFGAIIGDGCETGCNSVLCPLVLLEPNCWIMPNYCVIKGVYKKGKIFR